MHTSALKSSAIVLSDLYVVSFAVWCCRWKERRSPNRNSKRLMMCSDTSSFRSQRLLWSTVIELLLSPQTLRYTLPLYFLISMYAHLLSTCTAEGTTWMKLFLFSCRRRRNKHMHAYSRTCTHIHKQEAQQHNTHQLFLL